MPLTRSNCFKRQFRSISRLSFCRSCDSRSNPLQVHWGIIKGWRKKVGTRIWHNFWRPVWPKGGNFPILWDFWPKRGDRFLRMGNCGIFSKRGGFWRISQKTGKMSSFDQKSGHFCIKNLKIFSLKNFPKKK